MHACAQNTTNCNVHITCYCHICASHKYAHQFTNIYHMFRGHICATYEVPGINHMTRGVVHTIPTTTICIWSTRQSAKTSGNKPRYIFIKPNRLAYFVHFKVIWLTGFLMMKKRWILQQPNWSATRSIPINGQSIQFRLAVAGRFRHGCLSARTSGVLLEEPSTESNWVRQAKTKHVIFDSDTNSWCWYFYRSVMMWVT